MTRNDDADRHDANAVAPRWVVPGFNLLSARRERVAARRRQCFRGWALALGAGVAGGLVLHTVQYIRHTQDVGRRAALSDRLAQRVAGLREVRTLEQRLSRDAAQRAAWAQQVVQRQRLRTLMLALSAVSEEGIAVTGIRFTDNALATEWSDSEAVAGLDDAPQAGSAPPVLAAATLTDDTGRGDPRVRRAPARVQIHGIADDADGLARWATRLAGQAGIDALALESMERFEASAAQASGVVRFRLGAHLGPGTTVAREAGRLPAPVLPVAQTSA